MQPSQDSTQFSEEFIRRVIASSPDCIKVLDLDGHLLSMSEGGQKVLEIIDLTPHLGTCWTGWWEGGDYHADAAAAVEEARQGNTGHFEAFAHTFGGTPKWWDVTVSPILGPDGKPERLLSVSRDITRRKVAEQKLAEVQSREAVEAERSRFQLAEAFRRSPSFLAVLHGPEHVFELANDRYYQLVGERDILQKPVRAALPELVGQGFYELLDRVYSTGEPFVGDDLPISLQREADRAPEQRFVSFVYQPTHAPDGTITGILVHGVDVTGRKASEGAVSQLSEQRRHALDSAQLGWYHLDLGNAHVSWDERFSAIFGIEEHETSLEEAFTHLHPDDQPTSRERVAASIRAVDPVPYRDEYRVVHPDGSVRWVQSRGKTNFAGEGEERRAVSLVGTVMDVTEAKAIQAAVLESEAKFRQLADAMPQMVFSGTPDGHLDYYNQPWYDYTGLAPGETGVEAWVRILHPDEFQPIIEAWTATVSAGEPYEREIRIKHAADGEYRWFLSRAQPIKDPAGKVVRWFGTDTDIHESKLLREQNDQLLVSERAARSEAERTSQLKDEFLATLSHELRTPLNAILGWAQVLRDGDADKEDLDQGLATIERNARAQTQIIEDLLDMSKIISGKVRLDVQRLNLVTTLEGAVKTMVPTANTKSVRLSTTLDPDAFLVSGDPNRLQQVFWNLLSNAIKFTPKGGRVQVVLERVNSHLEVSVIDSGQGIKAEFLPYVFDRFRQQDATTTRQHGGLGLGLAIVKQLVELHGGNVRVKSPGEGKGTTFIVSLPLTVLHPEAEPMESDRRHPQVATSHPNLRIQELNLQGVKVLVVDDEADARALVKRLLEDRGASVRAAGSVDEAMRLLTEEKPDVLISDIGMPGEDGYSLLRRVRALGVEQGGAVPAVALTAYARAEDRMKAILAGFQMHVSKPVEPAELLTMVASLSGRTGNI